MEARLLDSDETAPGPRSRSISTRGGAYRIRRPGCGRLRYILSRMDELERLHDDIGTEERLRLVADFPIGEIVCAPGHRELRAPTAVAEMAERIGRSEWGDILAEPILLGIFTAEQSGRVRLRSIECLDGNHRLLGGLLAGAWRRIGDIPLRGLDARVNGWPPHGAGPEGRWIPLEVAQASGLDPSDWKEVPESWGPKGPTAEIPGWISGLDPMIPEQSRGIPLKLLLEEWRSSHG